MKKSLGFTLVEVLLILVLIGIVGFTGYRVYMAQKDETPASTETVSQETASTEVIKAVKLAISEKYTVVKEIDEEDFSTPENQGEVFIQPGDSSPEAAFEEANFFTHADKGVSLKVVFSEGDSKAEATQTALLDLYEDEVTKQGLSLINEEPYTNEWYKSFSNKEVICNFSGSPVVGFEGTIRCALWADYEKPSATAKLFADAYYAAETDGIERGKLAIGTPEIKFSKTSGYQFAYVGLNEAGNFGGAKGLFYKKVGTDWKFFIASQDTVPCADYESDPDVRVAFKGEICGTPEAPGSTVN